MERHILDVLRSSFHINQFKQIHALILTYYTYLSPLLVQRLCHSSQLKYARKMFDEMPEPDERLYNMFISGYSKLGSYKQALGINLALTGNSAIFSLTCFQGAHRQNLARIHSPGRNFRHFKFIFPIILFFYLLSRRRKKIFDA